ncbi:hypothetical protein GCM10017557_40390 [Streptomyces aurantiacus]|uniref:Tyr recombinase domain-containing protein n=1 Tax=Streptomyces aurantiacus TaxID=47760 RepID=A0A7G1P5R9_9ACTN|nr:hypothetical protein GCM10017557_40390 [Streptomyces aurantiacus]
MSEEEIEPYTVEEVQRLLRTADDRRNSARWAVALALGLRQGEAFGLKWTDVDAERGVLMVRRSRRRPRHAHGCGNPCGRKAGYCPQRQRTNPETADTKSRAGRRAVGLPAQLVGMLRAHRAKQDAERAAAGEKWADEDWLFATPDGRGTPPRTGAALEVQAARGCGGRRSRSPSVITCELRRKLRRSSTKGPVQWTGPFVYLR